MKIQKSILTDEEPVKTYYEEIGFGFAMVVMFFLLALMHVFSAKEDSSTYMIEMSIPVELGKVKDLKEASLQQLPPPAEITTVPSISLLDDIANKVMDKDENTKEDETTIKTDTIENKLSGNGAGKQAEADVEDPTPFAIIEEQPLFPGGTEALVKYLGENIKYPAKAKEAGISGTVIMSFIIEKDGTISNVKVFRGLGGGCNEEAIRVVSKMPRWTPGRQHNQPVRVQFHIPLNFFLKAK